MAAPKNSIWLPKQIKLGNPTLLGNQGLIKIGFFRLWMVFWRFGWFPGLSGSALVRFGSLVVYRLYISWRSGSGSGSGSGSVRLALALVMVSGSGSLTYTVPDLVLVVVSFGLAIPIETHPVAMDPFSGG